MYEYVHHSLLEYTSTCSSTGACSHATGYMDRIITIDGMQPNNNNTDKKQGSLKDFFVIASFQINVVRSGEAQAMRKAT